MEKESPKNYINADFKELASLVSIESEAIKTGMPIPVDFRKKIQALRKKFPKEIIDSEAVAISTKPLTRNEKTTSSIS